jgi:hypothetical protein
MVFYNRHFAQCENSRIRRVAGGRGRFPPAEQMSDLRLDTRIQVVSNVNPLYRI